MINNNRNGFSPQASSYTVGWWPSCKPVLNPIVLPSQEEADDMTMIVMIIMMMTIINYATDDEWWPSCQPVLNPIVLPSEDAQQTCSSLVVVGPKTASKWQLQVLTAFFSFTPLLFYLQTFTDSRTYFWWGVTPRWQLILILLYFRPLHR